MKWHCVDDAPKNDDIRIRDKSDVNFSSVQPKMFTLMKRSFRLNIGTLAGLPLCARYDDQFQLIATDRNHFEMGIVFMLAVKMNRSKA